MTGWLTDWLNDWLTDWLTDSPSDWLTVLLTYCLDWLTDWLTYSLNYLLNGLLSDWLIELLIDWLTHSLTGWLINLLIDCAIEATRVLEPSIGSSYLFRLDWLRWRSDGTAAGRWFRWNTVEHRTLDGHRSQRSGRCSWRSKRLASDRRREQKELRNNDTTGIHTEKSTQPCIHWAALVTWTAGRGGALRSFIHIFVYYSIYTGWPSYLYTIHIQFM